MNNNERPDHLWVTTFFSRASWTFYALTHFDGTVRIYMYISYIWKIHPIGSCLFFLLFLLSFDRKVYQACIYIYAFLHSSRRGIFPRHLDGPHAVVHAIRKERTKFDCTRLTRRGQVLVVSSRARERGGHFDQGVLLSGLSRSISYIHLACHVA